MFAPWSSAKYSFHLLISRRQLLNQQKTQFQLLPGFPHTEENLFVNMTCFPDVFLCALSLGTFSLLQMGLKLVWGHWLPKQKGRAEYINVWMLKRWLRSELCRFDRCPDGSWRVYFSSCSSAALPIKTHYVDRGSLRPRCEGI